MVAIYRPESSTKSSIRQWSKHALGNCDVDFLNSTCCSIGRSTLRCMMTVFKSQLFQCLASCSWAAGPLARRPFSQVPDCSRTWVFGLAQALSKCPSWQGCSHGASSFVCRPPQDEDIDGRGLWTLICQSRYCRRCHWACLASASLFFEHHCHFFELIAAFRGRESP